MLKKAIDVLKSFEADKDACLEQTNLIAMEKKPGSHDIKVTEKSGYVSGTLPPEVSTEKYEKILAELNKQGIDSEIEISVPVGGYFGNYG